MRTESISIYYGCIYKLTNKLTNKSYIGQTTNVKKRLSHYRTLHCKRQPRIYESLKEHGFDNFCFTILQEAESKEKLDELEVYYIKYYDSIIMGYNAKEGGSNGKHTPETRMKLLQRNRTVSISGNATVV